MEAITEELHYLNMSLEDIEGEIWEDIPEYDGVYQASTKGRIKTLRREYYRKGDSSPRYTHECIRKQTVLKCFGKPVLYVSLRCQGVRVTDTVSQWIGITFIGEKKKGFCFQHKNKNQLDNRAENIEQVSITESKKNDFKKGLREAHNYHTLPKAKYKITREDGVVMSYKSIEKEYGRSAYFAIIKGKKVNGLIFNVSFLTPTKIK
jgi:hypothetical protein